MTHIFKGVSLGFGNDHVDNELIVNKTEIETKIRITLGAFTKIHLMETNLWTHQPNNLF